MYSQEFINIQGKERKAREIEIYSLQVRDGERVKNREEDGKNINAVSGRLNLYIIIIIIIINNLYCPFSQAVVWLTTPSVKRAKN